MATETLTGEIAANLEEIAEVTRRIDPKSVGSLCVGIGIGAVVGFYFGYRYSKKKLRAEILIEAETEIEKIRAFYRQKVIAAQAQEKPSVDEIIRDKGYSSEEQERPLRPPVPIQSSPPVTREQIEDVITDVESEMTEETPVIVASTKKDPNENWAYPIEKSRRKGNAPYIIHQDEWHDNEAEYRKVAYTYYDGDDVLTDENENPIGDPDAIVGLNNLRFGHGTDDKDIVFIRNDHFKLDIEVCRIEVSYETAVLGLDPDEPD